MSVAMPLLIVLAILVVVGLLVANSQMGRGADKNQLSERELVELNGLRTLVEDLKQRAWDHREIDPDLSTIIIDEIRTFERKGRELGS